MTNAMPIRTLETAIPVVVDRNFPIEVFADAVKALQASGVVDTIQMWDQLTGWNPRCLWTPEKVPMAKVVPDLDSFPDWFPMVGYGAAVAPELNYVISVDSLRRGPTELTQSMMTLANITKGKAAFHIGAGEFKQLQPFGYDVKQKMGRLEDFYKIFDAFRGNCKTPIDYQGKYTTLDQAWLGVARNHAPKIWGLGGGPKVVDLSTSYVDGFATMGVMVWSSPEHAGEEIKKMKAKLIEKGRDAEDFGFGVYIPCLLHEDATVIDRALDDDMIRWLATIMGRINQGDWEKEGLPAPMGKDWHYANNLLPVRLGETETREMIGRSTRQHAEKSFLYGSPDKVAAEMKAFADAGVNWIGVLDFMPTLLQPAEAATAITRSIDVCRRLKGK